MKQLNLIQTSGFCRHFLVGFVVFDRSVSLCSSVGLNARSVCDFFSSEMVQGLDDKK